MQIHDVLVIGEGLEAALAALTARAAGASVVMAGRQGMGTSILRFRGAMQIAYSAALARDHGARATLGEHFAAMLLHVESHHPYRMLGVARTQHALRGGIQILRQALAAAHMHVPALAWHQPLSFRPSAFGALLPTALPITWDGQGHDDAWRLATSHDRWGVLQMVGDPNFDAEHVRRGLAYDGARLGYSVPELVCLSVDLRDILSAVAIASPIGMWRALCEPAVGQAWWQRLHAACADHSQLRGVIVAPVLSDDVLLSLSPSVSSSPLALDGAPHIGRPFAVIEAMGAVASVHSLRLQHALQQALMAANVTHVGEVQSFQWAHEGAHLSGVITRDGTLSAARACVIATGPCVSAHGAIADGMPLDPWITALDCVLHGQGLGVNGQLQPMRRAVSLPCENVFAAGDVLAGMEDDADPSRDGVALATAWCAGRDAAAYAAANSFHGHGNMAEAATLTAVRRREER